jgi:hypothetical protein
MRGDLTECFVEGARKVLSVQPRQYQRFFHQPPPNLRLPISLSIHEKAFERIQNPKNACNLFRYSFSFGNPFY